MFGSLGVPEILFILVVALLVFGPRRLPEIGRTIGRALGEFRRATTDLKRSIDTEVTLEEVRQVPPASTSGQAARTPVEPAAKPSAETPPVPISPVRTPAAQPGAPAEPADPDPGAEDAADPAD